MKLKGKIALITGSAQGMGRAIGIEIAKEGASVILVDINEEKLRETYEKDIMSIYKDKTVKGCHYKMDVTDEGQIKETINKIIEKFERIDILVNNAGVLSSYPIVELEEKEWDRVIDTNLKGTFLVTKAVLKHMINRRSGRIINIASDSGITGKKYLSHYCSSKFGVIGFTQSAAKETGEYNITVNAVCPGPTVTEIYHTKREMESKIRGISKEAIINEENKAFPLGRPAQPYEIARLVVFLASDENTYMTGEAINISGGLEVH